MNSWFYCLCLTLYAMVIYDQIFVHFVGFLSMVIYIVSLHTRCLRYNICSTWFLNIRISTCLDIRMSTCSASMITSDSHASRWKKETDWLRPVYWSTRVTASAIFLMCISSILDAKALYSWLHAWVYPSVPLLIVNS